jgi:hypothetical protein
VILGAASVTPGKFSTTRRTDSGKPDWSSPAELINNWALPDVLSNNSTIEPKAAWLVTPIDNMVATPITIPNPLSQYRLARDRIDLSVKYLICRSQPTFLNLQALQDFHDSS